MYTTTSAVATRPNPYQLSLLQGHLNGNGRQATVKITQGASDQFTPRSHIATTAPPDQAQAFAPAEGRNPKVDIYHVQKQLVDELPELDVRFLNTDKFGELNGRLAQPGELESMMEALFSESEIPFGYITDGCYARAHLMDESFRQHGINHAKMFVRGDLAAENDLMNARWWYHVAPLVFVDDGEGKPAPKIVDPGFSLKPMDPEQWVEAMNQGPRIEVDLVEAKQYHPRRYRAPDTFAESLPPAVSRMQNYSAKLHGIKESKGLPVDPYETPSWEAPGSGGDFEHDGKLKTIFPLGIQTASSVYLPTGLGVAALQLDLFDHSRIQPDTSARWEDRPPGFDPYAA